MYAALITYTDSSGNVTHTGGLDTLYMASSPIEAAQQAYKLTTNFVQARLIRIEVIERYRTSYSTDPKFGRTTVFEADRLQEVVP